MSSATIFLFLLDSLPDFQNALNLTLVKLCEKEDISMEFSGVNECNPIAAQSALKVVKNAVEEISLPNHEAVTDSAQRNNKYKNAYNELSPEALYNIGTVFENTVEDYSDIVNSFEATETVNEKLLNHQEIEKQSSHIFRNDVQFPENTPSLVAMFETIANITAQTCGGTLLSSRWALTTSSCLGLLSDLNENSTKLNKSDKSKYTIISSASNPLIDGTVHNVTELILLPKVVLNAEDRNGSITHDKNKTNKLGQQNRNVSLVLLRIEPAAKVKALPISGIPTNGGEDVQVYGWMIEKDKTGGEIMKVASFSAKTLRSDECRPNISSLYHDSIFFLIPQKDVESKVNQMNGGPVLVVRNNKVHLLGVVQLEQPMPQAPLFAHSLASHADWINDFITNK